MLHHEQTISGEETIPGGEMYPLISYIMANVTMMASNIRQRHF